MNLRERQLLAWSAAVVTALGAAGVLLAAWLIPPRLDDLEPPIRPLATAPAPAQNRPDLPELQRLAATDLRRPLKGDPAPPPGGAPLTVQLVGTAMEEGHSAAMFKKGDGNIVVCAQGESVDDVGGPVTVTRIAFDRVSVQYAGSPRDLILPAQPSPPMEATP